MADVRHAAGGGEDLDSEQVWLHRLTSPTSLNAIVGEDKDMELADLQPDVGPGPEDLVLAADESATLVGLLDGLDDRARLAMEMRYGLINGRDHTYQEIGEALDLTREAVRLIVVRSLRVLRSWAEQPDSDAA